MLGVIRKVLMHVQYHDEMEEVLCVVACKQYSTDLQTRAVVGQRFGSGPLLVIVEREVPYTAYGHDVREVKHVRHATGSHACTTLTRTARPSRWPRRRSGTPGVIPQPHLWRHASLRGLGFCKGS